VFISNYAIRNWAEFQRLETVSLSGSAPIFLLTLVMLALAALRYWFIIKEFVPSSSYLNALRHVSLSRFLNLILPQSGLAYKAYALRYNDELSKSQTTSSILAFIWIDIGFTLLSITCFIALVQHNLEVASLPLLPAVAVATAAFFLVTLGGKSIVLTISRRLENYATPYSLTSFLNHMAKVFEFVVRPKLLVVAAVVIPINFWLGIVRLEYSFLLFDISADWALLGLFVALNRLSTVIPITPGNLGVLEIVFGLVGAQLGIGMAAGITVALTLRVINFVSLATVSAIMLLHARITRERLTGL
jgi:uncharacterized protein (TIRG00374 family)